VDWSELLMICGVELVLDVMFGLLLVVLIVLLLRSRLFDAEVVLAPFYGRFSIYANYRFHVIYVV